jgi:hypothetical protein
LPAIETTVMTYGVRWWNQWAIQLLALTNNRPRLGSRSGLSPLRSTQRRMNLPKSLTPSAASHGHGWMVTLYLESGRQPLALELSPDQAAVTAT